MKNKHAATVKIEKIINLLSRFDNELSRGVSLLDAREKISHLKEELEALQTLINSERDSWNY